MFCDLVETETEKNCEKKTEKKINGVFIENSIQQNLIILGRFIGSEL